MNNNHLNQTENLDLEYAELSELELENISGGNFGHSLLKIFTSHITGSYNQRIGSGSGSNLGRGSGFAVIPGTLAINPFW